MYIRENQREINSMSREMSGKVREFCSEIAVAALCVASFLLICHLGRTDCNEEKGARR